MQKRWNERPIKVFLYGTLLFACVLFMKVLPLGHDLHFHLYRIGAMAEELEKAPFRIPIRILSTSYNHYGYGVPLFYGDLLLYIPAALTALGMEAVTAYKLLMVLIFLSSFAAMHHQIYRSSNSKNFAFLAAVFYILSSYYLLDLCIRMSIGEACACIFLPFVFCSFYNMLYQPQKGDWIYLTIGMSGLILSHNLTAVFTAGILGIWAILQLRRILRRKTIGSILQAVLVTIGLTASYVFPFIEANMVQKYQIPGNNEYQMQEFAKHALDVVDFFMPYDIKKGVSALFHMNWNTDTWHPGAVGVFLLAIIFLAFKTRREKKNKILSVFFWIAFFAYIGMFLKPLVKYMGQFLSFIQFGWRLLLFCTFAFAVYAAYLLNKYCDKRCQDVYVILAILTACYTIGPRYVYQAYLDYKGMEYIQSINEEYYEHYIMEYSPNSGDALYLPEGVSLYLYEERGERVVCNNENATYEITRQEDKCELTVADNFSDDTRLELPLYYYKGYAAIDRNTGKYRKVSSSSNKLVEVSLDGMQEADLEIWYKGTLTQRLGNWISGLTLLAVLFHGFWAARQIKYKKKRLNKWKIYCR